MWWLPLKYLLYFGSLHEVKKITINFLQNMHYFSAVCSNNLSLTFRYYKDFYPFKRQAHKMIKHTQPLRWQIADKWFDWV